MQTTHESIEGSSAGDRVVPDSHHKPSHHKIVGAAIAATVTVCAIFALLAIVLIAVENRQVRAAQTTVWPEEPAYGPERERFNFEGVSDPILSEYLSHTGTSRIREITIQVGSDAESIDIAVRSPMILASDGDGIAVRTTSRAVIVRRNELVRLERPASCIASCELVLWLSMGEGFQELHPDAEVMVFAGRHGSATIIDSGPVYPADMYGGS